MHEKNESQPQAAQRSSSSLWVARCCYVGLLAGPWMVGVLERGLHASVARATLGTAIGMSVFVLMAHVPQRRRFLDSAGCELLDLLVIVMLGILMESAMWRVVHSSSVGLHSHHAWLFGLALGWMVVLAPAFFCLGFYLAGRVSTPTVHLPQLKRTAARRR